MATITKFIWHEMEVDDPRDVRDAKIRNKIVLKTSDRVTWTELRKMRPVPQWNDAHPKEPGFYLDFIHPVHKSRHIWELDCEYVPFSGGQVDANPLARAAEITFDTSLVEQPTLKDAYEKPIVTTAGEFIEGVMEQIPLVEYTIIKNLASDPRWLQTHLGQVNNEQIRLRGLLWAPKTLLLASVSGGKFTTENRVSYAEYTLKLLADARGWTQEVWNRGTVQLVQVKKTFTDENGNEVTRDIWTQVPIEIGDPPEAVSEPVPLDEKGRAIVDFLQQDRTAPLKPSRLLKLYFETQRPVQFQGVLPLA